jgi:hypothetical protein
MQFEPMGGFPPIIRNEDTKITEKTLESRGFADQLASISDIMRSKKKEELATAFGSDQEDGADFILNKLNENPYEFSKIEYKEMPKKKINII